MTWCQFVGLHFEQMNRFCSGVFVYSLKSKLIRWNRKRQLIVLCHKCSLSTLLTHLVLVFFLSQFSLTAVSFWHLRSQFGPIETIALYFNHHSILTFQKKWQYVSIIGFLRGTLQNFHITYLSPSPLRFVYDTLYKLTSKFGSELNFSIKCRFFHLKRN